MALGIDLRGLKAVGEISVAIAVRSRAFRQQRYGDGPSPGAEIEDGRARYRQTVARALP